MTLTLVFGGRWTSPTPRRTRRSATSCEGWLDENLPKFLAEWARSATAHAGRELGTARWRDAQAWQRRLNEGRWAAINWPRDWGGREATPMQNVIYSEEMARATHARASTTPTASGRSAR